MRSLFLVDLLAQVQSFSYQHGGDERREERERKEDTRMMRWNRVSIELKTGVGI